MGPDTAPAFEDTSPVAADQVAAPEAPPSFDDTQPAENYQSAGQQAIAGLEGAAQGVAGPLAPLAERALGVKPEDIRARAELNPWTHGIGEAAGFGAGMFTGASEASLVGNLGERAGLATAQALTGGVASSGASYVGARLAAGAAKMATEFAALQASNEVSKAILEDPNQSIGSAVTNVGLSGLLGGVGGAAFSGLGLTAKGVINNPALADFKARLSFRGSNLNPNEMMEKELTDAVNSYHQIGDEVNGVTGLKANAIKEALPEEITPAISNQVQDLSQKSQDALSQMIEKEAPPRLIKDFQGTVNRFMETATNPNASVSDNFDAINQFKNDLQDYSKGRWGLNAVQRTAEDYNFIKITKELSSNVRSALEDSGAWGDAADVQKSINKAWSDAIPAVKDIESKFMSKIGNDRIIDPQKFATYVRQGEKATSPTIRQQMMGNFIDAMDQFHQTVGSVAERAGIENPIDPISMSSLKESLNRPSVGTRLADLWYDKLGSRALGNVAGAAVGESVAPGFGGAYVGKEVLGPVFGSVIQPIIEKTANSRAFQQAMAFGKAVAKGDSDLEKSAANLFIQGAKTVPDHLWPDEKQISKLDEQIKKLGENPSPLLDNNGNLGHYMPNHAQAASSTAMNAVNMLNAQRPKVAKMSPLDSDLEPSKDAISAFRRKLGIAQQPLMPLHYIKNGQIVPSDVATLRQIYPNYYNKVAQQLTAAMTDHISKGETVPYKTRQGLSLFLGQPLDSTMTPQALQAIQSTYAIAQPQSQQQGAPKKGAASKLGKSAQSAMTPGQARESRSNQ